MCTCTPPLNRMWPRHIDSLTRRLTMTSLKPQKPEIGTRQTVIEKITQAAKSCPSCGSACAPPSETIQPLAVLLCRAFDSKSLPTGKSA